MDFVFNYIRFTYSVKIQIILIKKVYPYNFRFWLVYTYVYVKLIEFHFVEFKIPIVKWKAIVTFKQTWPAHFFHRTDVTHTLCIRAKGYTTSIMKAVARHYWEAWGNACGCPSNVLAPPQFPPQIWQKPRKIGNVLYKVVNTVDFLRILPLKNILLNFRAPKFWWCLPLVLKNSLANFCPRNILLLVPPLLLSTDIGLFDWTLCNNYCRLISKLLCE